MQNNIIPQSRLFLLKNVPLTPDYEYTLDFNSKEEQDTYFGAKIDTRLEEEDYSYIRADDTINIALPIEQTEGVNYMTFYNNGKTYFAFIERKDYVSPNVTKLYFKIDVFQTFMFDYELQESFIDREHQDRIEYVDHTGGRYHYRRKYNRIAENLELGKDYKGAGRYLIPSFNDRTETYSASGFYVIKCSKPLGKHQYTTNGYTDNPAVTKQFGVSTGVYVYLIPSWSAYIEVKISATSSWTATNQSNPAVIDFLTYIRSQPQVLSMTFTKYVEFPISENAEKHLIFDSTLGRSTATLCIVNVPYEQPDGHTDQIIETPIFALRDVKDTFIINVDNKSVFDRVDPISINAQKSDVFESKLQTHPYKFIRYNINGKTINLNFEDFINPAELIVVNSYNPQGTMSVVPGNYNGVNFDYNYQTEIENNNEITLTSDRWLEYLMNNKASVNGGLVTAGIQTVATIGLGVATGGVGLAFAGGQALGFAGQVANELMKREDIKNQPDNVKASKFDIMINHSLNWSKWFYEIMEIKPEFKTNIFEYFYHFGYKANCFKKPNTRSRYYFNYIKTIGVKIQSGIDRRWEDELREIYNRGVTIWHFRDASTFKGVNNYDYENVEMALITLEEA